MNGLNSINLHCPTKIRYCVSNILLVNKTHTTGMLLLLGIVDIALSTTSELVSYQIYHKLYCKMHITSEHHQTTHTSTSTKIANDIQKKEKGINKQKNRKQ